MDTIDKVKKWLAESPPEEIVHRIEPEVANSPKYIPIGQVEQLLDELCDNWGVDDITTSITKTAKYWFYDCNLILYVEYCGMRRTMPGGVTMRIGSKDDNIDYSATAISYSISNACKRMGIRFGRALNNRLNDKETTSIPSIDLEFDRKLTEVLKLIESAETSQAIAAIYNDPANKEFLTDQEFTDAVANRTNELKKLKLRQ